MSLTYVISKKVIIYLNKTKKQRIKKDIENQTKNFCAKEENKNNKTEKKGLSLRLKVGFLAIFNQQNIFFLQ